MIENAPKEPRPPWAMINPAHPFLGEILRGVRYQGLEAPTLRAILDQEGCRVIAAYAAMGPRLFWGRTDGPWIPYDLDAKDQNEEKIVRDREWPWCWGDYIWAAAYWDAQPLYIAFGPDSCELYLGTPFVYDHEDELERFCNEVYEEALRVAESSAVPIPAHRFHLRA